MRFSTNEITRYSQPTAGTTEQYIDVIPANIVGDTSSSYKALATYQIRDFGHGLTAVEQIVRHIFKNKLHSAITWEGDVWQKTVVITFQCKLRQRATGKLFSGICPGTIDEIIPNFDTTEWKTRESDIVSYAAAMNRGVDMGQPLYISSTVLNYLGANLPERQIFMIDGARRITASALNHQDSIPVQLIVLENEYAELFEKPVVSSIQKNIASLSWFDNYQSIPIIGILGGRTLNRFRLMDMDLLRDASVLDFGCNLGQACIKSVMAGAREVWGVEGMPDTYSIASQIGKLSGFPNLHYMNVNFNDADFDSQIESRVPGRVDYSLFFSVYRTKELTQRDRLFKYIIDKTTKGIFFEGHADPKIDSLEYYNWLFESFGLTARYLGNSEGELRPLFFIPLEGRQKAEAPQAPNPAAQPTRPSRYLVSAIVSTYKSERFIEGRLQDLLAQTLGDLLEIVVVDSGSPENEGEIVRSHAARHQNITYIRTEERETVYQAWNRGILASSGKYVTNANTDDRLRQDALEVLAAELDAHPDIVLAYGDFFITGYENMPFQEHIRTGYSIKPDYDPSIMLHGCHMGPQPVWRRSLHDELGLFDGSLKSAGDYEFWCRVACRYPMKHIPEFLGLYLHNPSGIINSDTSGASLETQHVKEMYQTRLPAPRQNLPTGFYFRQAVEPGRYVNIGMITYNRLEFTSQAIEALLRCTDFPYVLTVIDNASTDDTREYLQEQKRRGIIKNLVLLDKNVGVAKASNIAWNIEPDAAYYLKLDNDIVIQKSGWLSDMVCILDDIPDLGALAYNFEPTSYPVHNLNGHTVRQKNGNLGGACFLIPARTHEKLGDWCEDYGLYSEEDYDYCYRMSLSGIQYHYMADENIGFHLPAGKAAKIDQESFNAKDGVEEDLHAEYRHWKDNIRREVCKSGLRDRNFTGYNNGLKSLRIISDEYRKWNDLGRPGFIVLQQHVSADKAIIKVAVFSLDSPEHACGHYRIYAPFIGLRGAIEVQQGILPNGQEYTIKHELAASADIIVVQRFLPRSNTIEFLGWLCSLGKPVIFEIDDLLTELPPSNPAYSWGIDSVPHIYDLIKKCSAVTVSTEELKRHFSAYNDTIYILPNMLDDILWSKQAPTTSGPVVIGYAGTITHATDLELVEGVLERIVQRYGNRVSFTFMGCATERLARLPGFNYVSFEVEYEAYARRLQEIPVDIMLVPLEDNPFNRSKSNIKWLEYSACGYAGIYADLPPYNTSVEHGRSGLLVGNNPQQWYEAISLLIENADLRRTIAANASAEVLARYSLTANAHKWLDTYRTIIRKHTAARQGVKAAPEVHTSKPVSIIIPLFNKVELTRRCLETLTASTPQHLYELILIDNGSTDGTHEFLSSLPANVKVIRNLVNQGFAKACNQGAQAASGKYLLFLNNDTEPQPGWLEPLLNTAEQNPGIAAVGCKLLFPDGTIQHIGVIIADDRVTPDPLVAKHIYYGFPADHPEANICREYQALTAACLLVRRDAFEAAQGLDEGYWNGYEDVDLCFKLRQEGWKLIYQPASVVVHHESKSGSERFAKAAQNIQRLHDKWLGIIKPDAIIHPDSRVEWLEVGASASTVTPPLVSIIIPLFNQAQLTKACVEAIRATAGDPGRYELILADNGSLDWTPEYLKSLGTSVVVISNKENQGFAKACNQGGRIAKGEYLLFLNNDTVLQPGWLDALLAGAREEGADIVGAKLLYPNGRVQHAGVAFNKNGIGYHIFKNFASDSPAVNKKRFMQCVTAACMLVSRQLFDELGGFDEQFRNGFEDVDFCLRAGQAGKRILYAPAAVVIHHEEQSEGRKRHDRENMQRYLTRWQGRVRCDDEELYAAEGFRVEWRVDGSCTVQQMQSDHSRVGASYPLVPLVGSYAETPMARISASARMKAVMKKYSSNLDFATGL